LCPKPVFQVAREKDPRAKYEWQSKTFAEIIKMNLCKIDGIQAITKNMVKYELAIPVPFMKYIHDGGYEVPEGVMPAIEEFYKAIAD